MKLALVHDFLNQYGGAERVMEVLAEIFPGAPVFTSIFLPQNLPPVFSTWDVRTSFMQRLPFLDRHFKKYLPVYPLAMESLDLNGFDVILSSSSSFAKGIRVPSGARHICYCYTPMRFAWNTESYLQKEAVPSVLKPFLPPLLSALRRWDQKTAAGVDHFIAISRFIQSRIRSVYGRDSEVIYPPVETGRFHVSDQLEDYFLVVSRLNAYKRIDLVIEAFNRLAWPLVIIGGGSHGPWLKRMAGPTVRFLDRVSQVELARALSRCRALIFPGEEDFGIAPVEAMASGRPVIAFRGGGALETVKEGVTGIFFDHPTVDSLEGALRCFTAADFDPREIRRNALRFDRAVFKREICEFMGLQGYSSVFYRRKP